MPPRAQPNPRLQRTPLASPPSPLSRKPLGAAVKRVGAGLVANRWSHGSAAIRRAVMSFSRIAGPAPLAPALVGRLSRRSVWRIVSPRQIVWRGKSLAPNKSLQRTRAAGVALGSSPLSSQPLGGSIMLAGR